MCIRDRWCNANTYDRSSKVVIISCFFLGVALRSTSETREACSLMSPTKRRFFFDETAADAAGGDTGVDGAVVVVVVVVGGGG